MSEEIQRIDIDHEFAVVKKRGRPKKEVTYKALEERINKINQNHKNYYEKHKQIVLAKAAVKVMCESCGFEVTKTYMKKHVETKRHKQIAERKTKAKLAQEQEVPEVQL